MCSSLKGFEELASARVWCASEEHSGAGLTGNLTLLPGLYRDQASFPFQ